MAARLPERVSKGLLRNALAASGPGDLRPVGLAARLGIAELQPLSGLLRANAATTRLSFLLPDAKRGEEPIEHPLIVDLPQNFTKRIQRSSKIARQKLDGPV